MIWKTELTKFRWTKWFAIYPVCVEVDRTDPDRHWRVWVWLELVEQSQLGKAVVYRKKEQLHGGVTEKAGIYRVTGRSPS